MADKPQVVWVDGKLVPWNEATIHMTSIGTAGVSSVFEGIRAYWNETERRLYVLQLDAHLQRLAQSMRLLRMRPTVTPEEIKTGVLALLRTNRPEGDTYVRPLAFVESVAFGSASQDVPHIVMHSSAMSSKLLGGQIAHACVSSWSRITDNVLPPRIKASSNYLNSRLASEEAKRNGYTAALLLNPSGKVAEAPGACLMIVRDGRVITPSVTSGILESITRATVIRLCREVLHLEVIERDVDRTELYVAEEAFICGTGAEIQAIGSVDRLALGDGTPGPITRAVEKLYHDLVRGMDSRYAEWRTPV